ncbi:hypothetical protein HPB50_020374 [Hyalomma asiaticum]|uniref:Uncharacterized protein n=1 Tax=Hyalomma asiaticum TaxID=266040 RepID=A0ACB7SPV9_HYAAI|nr:hypothetical protein HPB50_020374 [Hyalomma asiaticum]
MRRETDSERKGHRERAKVKRRHSQRQRRRVPPTAATSAFPQPTLAAEAGSAKERRPSHCGKSESKCGVCAGAPPTSVGVPTEDVDERRVAAGPPPRSRRHLGVRDAHTHTLRQTKRAGASDNSAAATKREETLQKTRSKRDKPAEPPTHSGSSTSAPGLPFHVYLSPNFLRYFLPRDHRDRETGPGPGKMSAA